MKSESESRDVCGPDPGPGPLGFGQRGGGEESNLPAALTACDQLFQFVPPLAWFSVTTRSPQHRKHLHAYRTGKECIHLNLHG